jgi:hypothetical protein
VPPQAAASKKTFQVSNDPKFAEKLVDAVGLSLDPPEHARVPSERSPCSDPDLTAIHSFFPS